MNTLIQVRANVMYAKKKDESGNDKYERYQELIFLVDQPAYRLSNDGDIVRERKIAEMRFIVSDDSFGQMMEMLEELRHVEPEKLH